MGPLPEYIPLTSFDGWHWAVAILAALIVGTAKTGVPGLGFLAVPAFAWLFLDARASAGYPRKGSIGVGFDADIFLRDPKLKKTIRSSDLNHGSDYTPWEGFEVTGWPVTTNARGRVVVDHGEIVGERAQVK